MQGNLEVADKMCSSHFSFSFPILAQVEHFNLNMVLRLISEYLLLLSSPKG